MSAVNHPSQPGTVALFGEVLADIFPDQSILGGAPFNVARHLQAFGVHALLISRIGQDALADALLQHMAELELDGAGIQRDASHPTGQVRVTLGTNGHSFDIQHDQAYDHINAAETRQVVSALQPQLAYFGTLALRSAKSRQAAEEFLTHCNCPIFLDINLRAPWYDESSIAMALGAADIVKLNHEELQAVAAMFGLAELNAEAQAAALQQHFALHQVLVTCGDKGCWLLDEQQWILHAAPVAPELQVIDTIGAGDAFAAVFMLGKLRHWDTQTTLHRACNYAAAMCGVRGAAAPTGDFLELFRRGWKLS